MGQRWALKGWKVYGTYRTSSPAVEEMRTLGIELVHCDLLDPVSVREACRSLSGLCGRWDVLLMCPATQDPIGAFLECSFDEWEDSIRCNFTSQMRIIHALLPYRRSDSWPGPCALLFAGGGTNSAPPNYSAYIVSKIAEIKMCELLDTEIPDTRFVILGPGWVKTKIHESSLQAGTRAGDNYQRTIDKLAGDECTPMEQVLDCCDWLVAAPRQMIGGRNFSVVYDSWGSEGLEDVLVREPDMYKLRRYGNDWQSRS